jgi:hypothetical protein
MKPKNIFREIFQLAVRLVGLFFLCLGLKDLFVQTFTALTQLRGASLANIVVTFLPVVFTLALAVWLLRGKWLVQMAYPETETIIEDVQPAARLEAPDAKPAESQGLSDMEIAEKKLAELVGKPQDNRHSI